MASIIAIGNPGVGKSTILNAVAGKVLFKSGKSFGHGVTYELNKATTLKGTFYDTPGLADKLFYKIYYRQAAGDVIRDSLREGGPFKLLFFVLTESGKVVEQDIATLKLVLDATPEVGNNYGVIINKVPQNVAKVLENPRDKKLFLTNLLSGIEETRRCALRNITYILQKSELYGLDNALVDLDDLNTLQGDTFRDFIHGQVPTVQLTPGGANDIAFDELNMSNPITMLQQQIDQKQKEIDAASDNSTRTTLQIQQLNLQLIFIHVKWSRC